MAARAHRVEPGQPEPIAGDPAKWDYADAFEVTPTEHRTAEEWARATLERGPVALRTFVMLGWRFVLRLHLEPSGSLESVAGWPIVLRTPETIVLSVKSGVLGRARLTFHEGPSVVRASSNIVYERPAARTIWSVGGVLHRRILPYLLGHAASSSPL